LTEYDVIILPGGFGLNGTFDENSRDELKSWIRNGGTLVATEGATEWLTKEQSGITTAELFDTDKDEDEDKIDPAAYTKYKDQEDSSGLKRIPGSAFKAMIDNSHPLAFGMKDKLYSLKFSTNALKPDPAFNTVGYYVKDAEEVLASGYASIENKEKASGKTFAAVHGMGRGNVVFLMDNTQYRMFWVGPARMMQNAVMLVPGF